MTALQEVLNPGRLSDYIESIQRQNQSANRLDGWFLAREIMMEALAEIKDKYSTAMTQAVLLERVCEKLPLSIRPGEIFAGTEADAFARSYALINPDFRIDSFEGYCDEDAVYNDIEPNADITEERIRKVREFWANQPFARALTEVYKDTGIETKEVVYFVERVTGHTVPDFQDALSTGIDAICDRIEEKKKEKPDRADYFDAMQRSLRAAVILARRYSDLASAMAAKESDAARKKELELIAETCRRVPASPARNLYEAIQSYILCWQAMNLEQSPNPFAFSVGNLDRILMPYLAMNGVSSDLAVQMVRHLLAFFCVGDRNWAISQNIMVGGMNEFGQDLTNEMSYIVLDAFRLSNYSQPNLSVKLHPGSPRELYQKVASFFFDFGHSTPSFFNDTVVFDTMRAKGIQPKDLPLYGAAGCQEPLVMGMESGNTTNSWLNLAKILELTLNDGVSLISNQRIAPPLAELGLPTGPFRTFDTMKKAFFGYLDYFLPRMADAANRCTRALALLPVPFHSAFMGARDSGFDMRDVDGPGAPYCGSGCLIHGLGTVADSFSSVRKLIDEGPEHGFTMRALRDAVRRDFNGFDEMKAFLQTRAPRYGNNEDEGDSAAADLLRDVSERVNALKNPFGRNFCADWSTPSTNLLYGYWTGATPNGRNARMPLSYGIDPQPGAATRGLLPRVASQLKLNTTLMTGGSASGMSVNPEPLKNKSLDERADYLRKIIFALFGYNNGGHGMMYVYFNVFSTDSLRDVLEHPEKYPNPVLVRIHGQYGDARHLSPDILRDDIIPRLDPMSTSF